MNSINKINRINQQELENNVSDSASWHADYKDTSYIFIGMLPFDINEMDIIKIFSQYGIPTHLNLIKDRETGKSRGFGYLKYEDYRSCVLAIDNLNGIPIRDKKIKVDHVYYQLKDGQNEDDFVIDYSEAERELKEIESGSINQKTKLIKYTDESKVPATETVLDQKEEDDEFADPMAAFLAHKNEEADEFADPMAGFLGNKEEKHKSRHHRHGHRHRKRGDGDKDKDRESKERRSREKSPSRHDRRSKGSSHYRDRDEKMETKREGDQ